MTKVLMVPSSLHDGATSCRTIAREGAATARRVMGIPVPDDVPAQALSEIHDAANQLQRSAIAAERQAIFLLQCSHRGILADGPFGSLGDITLPSLLSPWPMPAVPKSKHKDHGGLLDGLLGAGDELLKTGEGLADTGIALGAHKLDQMIPGLSDHIPYVGEKRRQFDEGVAWAIKHPDEFAKLVGEDAIDLEDWRKGDYAKAIGHNVAGLGLLFVAVGKLGRVSNVARGASKGEKAAHEALDAATSRQRALTAGERGPGSVEKLVGRRPAAAKPYTQLMHEGEVGRAEDRISHAIDDVEAAKQRLHVAREHRGEAAVDAVKEARNVGGVGSAKILDEPAEHEPPEPAL